MKRLLCILLILPLIAVGFPASALADSARAAVVICGDTGEVLYGRNADAVLSMASTTKIMTALLLCEHGALDTEITVTPEMVAVEGSSMGLLPGDTVTLHDLLYGMMLASGNDAANTTAIVVGGSIENFVRMMNDRATQMGLSCTHFATPSGLDADDHYTTARELALIAREALKNEDFAAAAASQSATLNYGNPPYRRTLTNHNRLLKSYEGLIGVKTGFTKKSGRCLVTAAKRDGKYVICVTLNDPNDWEDHRALLDFGLSALQAVVCEPPFMQTELPVIGGSSESISVTLGQVALSTTLDAQTSCRVYLPQFLYAPIKKGTQIGTAYYYSGDTLLQTVDIRAQEDIEAVRADRKAVFWDYVMYILSKF